MVNAEFIKKKAIELGATVCGIGDISHFVGDDPQRNPLSVLPNAKCIIGFGVKIPYGLVSAMDEGTQYYNYVNIGVKYIDEIFSELFLLKMAAVIENEGYDACLQRSNPGMKIKGDKASNPEVNRVYELEFAEAVSSDKAIPDVIIDYEKAAVVCGFGSIGLHNKVIAPKYGTFMRYMFIVTDMPLECDKPFTEDLCDKCGLCTKACPGNAIDDNGVDTWQCSVYYRGAHKSNPFMTDSFLKDDPDREKIINGEMRFDKKSAEAIYDKIKFLPNTHFGYVPCLCGRNCETVCYRHLKEVGKI